jgi:glutamate/tyrosine decarboxylase-like PLP-dependent enzyme
MTDELSTTDNDATKAPQEAPPAMERAEFEHLGRRVVAMIAAHLDGLGDGPVHPALPAAELREVLDQTFPEQGVEPEAIVDFIESRVLPYPLGNNHPRFFARIVGAGAPIGVLAEMAAAAMNPGVASAHAALPLGLETCVSRWLMELVGFPREGSMGLLVSGGSMATLTALAVARHWAAKRDGWDIRAEGLQGRRPAFVLYASEEAHSCVQKSAELLGLGSANLRKIPVDAAYRMDALALRAALAEDRAAGRRPFCVVGSAGTVNTGAIDPLDMIAETCAEEDLWFHIDGAYGAPGVADPDEAPRFAGMERAHSLSLDPHKWLSVPIECGALLVRDRALQHDAFSLVAPYLRFQQPSDAGELPRPFEHGIQLTRGFRALKLWATLLHLGRAGLSRNIARNNALARHLAEAVEAGPDLELLAPASLSIVCFRFRPAGWPGDQGGLDDLNEAIAVRVNAEGKVYVTPTTLGGRRALRACIIHYATTEADVDLLVRRVREAGFALAARRADTAPTGPLSGGP